jgi:hypothetical protein
MFRGMGNDERKWSGSIIVERDPGFKLRNGRMSNPSVSIREVEADHPPF